MNLMRILVQREELGWRSVVDFKLLARRLAHPMGRPWRLPYDFDVRAFAIGHPEELILDLVRDHRAHRASWRRERHLNRDRAAVENDSVNEPEVNDIDGDFRVVTFAQDFVDFVFGQHRWYWGDSDRFPGRAA